MTARMHPQAAYLALKAAARRLVERAGGLEASASITRVNKTTIGACTQATHEWHLAADVILDLEAEVGDPIVTRQLARHAGYELVPIGEQQATVVLDPTHMVAKLTGSVGDFAKSVVEMDEDGVREAHELKRCIAEVAEVIDRANRYQDMLQVHLARLNGSGQE